MTDGLRRRKKIYAVNCKKYLYIWVNLNMSQRYWKTRTTFDVWSLLIYFPVKKNFLSKYIQRHFHLAMFVFIFVEQKVFIKFALKLWNLALKVYLRGEKYLVHVWLSTNKQKEILISNWTKNINVVVKIHTY